jgi:RecB family exonuclease
MNRSVAPIQEEGVVETPFLSYSRISKYELCPEQYRLHYIERLRPRSPSANLAFGQTLHQALAALFQTGSDPAAAFAAAWRKMEDADLTYGSRNSWERFLEMGPALLNKFVDEEFPKLSDVSASEKPFEFDVTSLDVPFVGVIDLVATFEGKRTLVDFKTSASSYRKQDVVLSDQLSTYQLAVPDAKQIALCVFVKTKTPKIEWHRAKRSGDELTAFLKKAGAIAHDIRSGRFFKRPGMWCAWCDYLPVCMGEQGKANDTLVRVPPSR